LASGLLIIGVGPATKRLRDLAGLDKTYEMEILLGRRTATGDLEGKVLEEVSAGGAETDKIKGVLRSLEGETELEVPVYSALKVKGKPMYRLAREGKPVEPKKRVKITIVKKPKKTVMIFAPTWIRVFNATFCERCIVLIIN